MSGRRDLRNALNESSTTYQSTSTDPEQSDHYLERTPTRQSPSNGRNNRNANPNSATAKNMRPSTEPTASNREKQPQKSKAKPAAKLPQRPVLKPKNTQERSQNPKELVGAARRKKTKPALLETIRLQQSTSLLIPKAPFGRLVREIIQHVSDEPLRMTPESLEALRESAEMFLTSMFTDAFRITLNRNQVTLQQKDIQLLMLLQGPGSVGAR